MVGDLFPMHSPHTLQTHGSKKVVDTGKDLEASLSLLLETLGLADDHGLETVRFALNVR